MGESRGEGAQENLESAQPQLIRDFTAFTTERTQGGHAGSLQGHCAAAEYRELLLKNTTTAGRVISIRP